MKKMIGFIGATVGSYAGWYLGQPVGMMTGFMLSIVGGGVGTYFAVKAARDYV